MPLTLQARRILGALTVLLALTVTGAMAAPAEVADIEAVIQSGGEVCTGPDTWPRVAFTGTRTETRTLDFVHECGSALVYQQATVEARCPEGFRSCTVHVTVTTMLFDLNTWGWTLYGPVEGMDHYVRLELGDLRFGGYVHANAW